MSDYRPIACVEHERLEFAVLRRQKLRLEYRDEDGRAVTRTVLPTDVATRNGAEWLSCRETDGGAEYVIRLDHILSVEALA